MRRKEKENDYAALSIVDFAPKFKGVYEIYNAPDETPSLAGL